MRTSSHSLHTCRPHIPATELQTPTAATRAFTRDQWAKRTSTSPSNTSSLSRMLTQVIQHQARGRRRCPLDDREGPWDGRHSCSRADSCAMHQSDTMSEDEGLPLLIDITFTQPPRKGVQVASEREGLHRWPSATPPPSRREKQRTTLVRDVCP